MLFKKLLSNRLSLEYSRGEVALILVSGIVLVILNFYMITGLKPQQSAGQHVETVRLNR